MVSVRILEQLASGEQIGSIRMGVTADGVFTYEVEGGPGLPAVETRSAIQSEGDRQLDDVRGAAPEAPSAAPSAFSGPIAPRTTPTGEQPLQA